MIGRNYPNLELLTQRPPLVGKVFFVDSGIGSADNEGTDPGAPLLTITAALALCTASKGDAIIVMQNSPSAPPATETFPVSVNKAGVLLAGLYGRGLISDSGFGSDEQNVATLDIAANYVTVEDLYLGCDDLGTTGGIVTFTGSTYGATFRNCVFDMQYVAAYGIYAAADQPYLLVEDCVFGRSDIAGYTTACIHLGNATFNMVRRNIFQGFAGIAINIGANCGNATFLDNRFRLPSDTEGKAITCAAGSSGNFFDGNHAAYGTGAPVNNPYYDGATANYNDWGLNYSGGVAVSPSTG